MLKQITKLIIVIYLMSSVITQKTNRKTPLYINIDPNDENVIDDNPDANAELNRKDTEVRNNDLTSTQVIEPKVLIGHNINYKERNNKQKLSLNELNQTNKFDNIESEKAKKLDENKKKNSDDNSESDDETNSSEPSSEDTDLVDDRPSLDEKTKSKVNENGESIITDKQDELYTDDINTELIDTRPIKDKLEASERVIQNVLIDTRPNLDEDKLLEYFKSIGKHKKYKHKSREININAVKTGLNTEQVKNDRVVHKKHYRVSEKAFAYMAAVVKGGKYICAGALIDESWVLTAANGNHLTRETIRFYRVRLGSINSKKGGKLLPIKYYETHPYFNSSKPDYDLALIMLSRPVRSTVNIRPIRLQLTPKDVLATHFIMTSWHAIQQPGLNRSSVIKHHRILSVAHLHPTDPEDCLQELKDIGSSRDRVMCLEGGTENCVRDTGAPVVINGVLWGIISSWKPLDCDEYSPALATLVSERNISTWLHATVHIMVINGTQNK